MKKINIIVILAGVFLLGSSCYSQKEDNIWILGYGNERVTPKKPTGGINLIFRGNKTLDTVYVPRRTFFDYSNASICSPQGELLFYTNGTYVSHRNNWMMKNGDGLGQENWDLGDPMPQGILALPFPGHPHLYMIIHSDWNYEEINGKTEIIVPNLKYTLVDMTKDNGLGDVIEKNVVVSNKEHGWGGLTACRHANGRDWWVIKPGIKTSEEQYEIYIYLLDPNGLAQIRREYFPAIINSPIRTVMLSAFSPDGNNFVLAQVWNIDQPRLLHILNFNRCEGTFTFRESIVEEELGFGHSIAVSPNSRYLYNMQDSSVYQYDLFSDTISLSKTKVAEYDGFVDLFKTLFVDSAPGPNGKIYINTPSSSHYLHVIEDPDVRGIGCNVRQHSFRLPAYNGRTMPNFPNFRLGKLEGSPCDTLITSTRDQWADSRFKLYPNPTSGPISIELDLPEWSRDDVSISLYDVNGKEVYRYRFAQWAYIHTIDPGTLPAGVYLVRLEIDGAVVHTDRVVVN